MNRINIAKLRKSLKKNQKEFSQLLGIAQSYLSELENGKKPQTATLIEAIEANIDQDIIANFRESCDISQNSDASYIKALGNEVYTETGSGVKYFELSDNKFRMRVPLVPFNAYARYANEACSTIEQEKEEWDEVEFIVDKIGHGNYMAFEIKGDSMDDDSRRSFVQGDIVLARELDKIHWKDGLRYEKYPFWIIVLEGTILCKQIIDQNIETGEITCHSLNHSPEYSDFTINLQQVFRIFNIIQKTTTIF